MTITPIRAPHFGFRVAVGPDDKELAFFEGKKTTVILVPESAAEERLNRDYLANGTITLSSEPDNEESFFKFNGHTISGSEVNARDTIYPGFARQAAYYRKYSRAIIDQVKTLQHTKNRLLEGLKESGNGNASEFNLNDAALSGITKHWASLSLFEKAAVFIPFAMVTLLRVSQDTQGSKDAQETQRENSDVAEGEKASIVIVEDSQSLESPNNLSEPPEEK